jgi:hypothetical protein
LAAVGIALREGVFLREKPLRCVGMGVENYRGEMQFLRVIRRRISRSGRNAQYGRDAADKHSGHSSQSTHGASPV